MDYTYLKRTKQARTERKTCDIVSNFFDKNKTALIDDENRTVSRLVERVASAPSRNGKYERNAKTQN